MLDIAPNASFFIANNTKIVSGRGSAPEPAGEPVFYLDPLGGIYPLVLANTPSAE